MRMQAAPPFVSLSVRLPSPGSGSRPERWIAPLKKLAAGDHAHHV